VVTLSPSPAFSPLILARDELARWSPLASRRCCESPSLACPLVFFVVFCVWPRSEREGGGPFRREMLKSASRLSLLVRSFLPPRFLVLATSQPNTTPRTPPPPGPFSRKTQSFIIFLLLCTLRLIVRGKDLLCACVLRSKRRKRGAAGGSFPPFSFRSPSFAS